MKHAFTLILPVVFLSMAFGGGSRLPADLVLTNGTVFTADDKLPLAGGVAVRGDRIVFVGSSDEVAGWVGAGTKIVDLKGRLVLPGFIDAHLHFLEGGLRLLELDCRGIKSASELKSAVERYAGKLKPGEWVVGGGWDENLWTPPELPDRYLLDRAAPGNPVFLSRIDGHSCVVNSLALRISGIDRDTADPAGGKIMRDLVSGEPTGVLRESACGLVRRHLPPPSLDRKRKALELALAEARRLGLTCIQTMADREEFQLFQEFRDRDELTVRVYSIAYYPDEPLVYLERAHYLGIRRGFGDNFIRLGSFKCFADGSLGSRSAYLFQPYSDDPGNCGIPRMTPEELEAVCRLAAGYGFQPAVHAIGDRGVNMVLQAFSGSGLGRAARPRVEHCSVIRPQDVELMARIGAVASVQPCFTTSDMKWIGDRLGPERERNAYVWRSLLEAGIPVAFGTDWPVENLDPLAGLYAAVTRQDPGGNPTGGWHPEEKISVDQAVRCYTMGSAFAAFWEKDIGSVTPGKLADLVVLSKNILRLPPRAMLETRVDLTILGGKIIFSRN